MNYSYQNFRNDTIISKNWFKVQKISEYLQKVILVFWKTDFSEDIGSIFWRLQMSLSTFSIIS